jgi:hypothetical protein
MLLATSGFPLPRGQGDRARAAEVATSSQVLGQFLVERGEDDLASVSSWASFAANYRVVRITAHMRRTMPADWQRPHGHATP